VTERLAALHDSVAHLLTLSHTLDDDALATSAYPSEWTVGDVFSHLGSGAVIFTHMFDDVVHERDRVDGVHQLIWDEWNAKHRSAQMAEALAADARLLERFDTLDEERRGTFRLSLGPLELDFEGVIGARLNEHALHTWDIDVTFDPAATLPPRVAAAVVDNLGLVTRFGAKPDGEPRTIHVRTSEPTRDLVLDIRADEVELRAGGVSDPDLELPAESFVRLVYGRLDQEHTPAGVETDVLGSLRRVFRGL
jgi:uncharacterized protein (TIGR03083 family)